MSLLELIFDDAQSAVAHEQLVNLLTKFSKGLDAVDLGRIASTIIAGRYQNMQESDILDMAYLNAKPLNKDHYQYSYFCARILIQTHVMRDVRDILNLPKAPDNELLIPGLRHGRRCGMIDERLLDGRFDLEWLASALKPKRNELLTVLSAQTLYDRYLQHDGGVRYETIQTMFMRIAMGLAVDEDNPTQRALEFYELLSSFDYMSSTPTLFNAGTKRPQLSSCYLTTIQDDLYNIYGGIRNNAMLSKWSGGIGNDWSRVRALNSHIKGTNGKSQGTVPFLKVNNDTAVAVNQCFAPETTLYVRGTVKAISDVHVGDLVLGVSGTYREVLDVMKYDQTDAMVEVKVVGRPCIHVTASHPLYVKKSDDGVIGWVETKDIKAGDYLGIPIPKEIVKQDVDDFSIMYTPDGIDGKYMHLPHNQTEQLIGHILSSGKLSSCLLQDVTYQLVRLGTLAEVGPENELNVYNNKSLDDQTPVVMTDGEYIWTLVESNNPAPTCPVVYDLIVEGDESYTLTSGLAHNGGKRKGAFCAYLTTWHLDIEEFLELRKNTGDERRRTHDMNTANWIPDLFMQRMLLDQDWTLFSPNEVPELNETYGTEFEKHYTYYEENAKALNILHKRVKAKDLWRKMLSMLFETGHPWITFKDPCNIRSPQSHVGIVRSSNLCCIALDQRVATDEGLVTIGELYSNQRQPLVAGRGEVAQGSNMLLPRPNAPMVKIHTREGYSHKVTPDHRVWVIGKGIVEAQHLEPNDKLELQWTQLFGKTHKPMLAYLTGLLAGDGTFTDSGVRLDFWQDKTRHLAYDALGRALDVLRDTDVELGKRANFDIDINSNEQKDYFHSASLAKVLANEGVTKETKLVVPQFVWTGDVDTVSAYIRGLFLTDGTISSSGDTTVASLSSTSQELLKDVQILLINLGIKSSVSMMKDAGINIMPDGNGGEAEYTCQAVYRLHVTSIQACKLLEEVTSIGFHRNNVKYLNNLTKEGYKQKLHATFTHLEELPNEDAYCLTVDSEDHAWTVNGFITHNTEITLNTSDEEIAVCNLGSVNLVQHITDGRLDEEKLSRTITTAIRMLDNVISINYYPVEEAETSNLKHRPIGLGLMGFQDALYKLGHSYASQAAVDFADESMELISYYAIKASADLARERGSYATFEGSTWSKGLVPLDTLNTLITSRPQGMIEVDTSSRLGQERWDEIRELVRGGMRNSNVMAIAPTATISNICGVTQSIEPTFQNLYVKSNLSGEFTVNNPYLVDKLIELGLWDLTMSKAILNSDGSIQNIPNIPEDIKRLFLTAFEVDSRWIVDAASRRQKWIDQAQSLNLYIANANGKKLDLTYKMAWLRGLKTTYYLRAIGATSTEKSTGDTHLNAVSATAPEFSVAAPIPGACSIDNPECEACT